MLKPYYTFLLTTGNERRSTVCAQPVLDPACGRGGHVELQKPKARLGRRDEAIRSGSWDRVEVSPEVYSDAASTRPSRGMADRRTPLLSLSLSLLLASQAIGGIRTTFHLAHLQRRALPPLWLEISRGIRFFPEDGRTSSLRQRAHLDLPRQERVCHATRRARTGGRGGVTDERPCGSTDEV